ETLEIFRSSTMHNFSESDTVICFPGFYFLLGNLISGDVPLFLGLSKVSQILLNNNNFTYCNTSAFDWCTSLITVNMDYNQIRSPVPDFVGCTSLLTFSANHNQFYGTEVLFSPLWQALPLTTLRLSYNNFTCPIA